MYASMIEGFFKFSHMVSGFSEVPIPELSEFHPYHPLTHMVVKALFWLTGGPGQSSALHMAVLLSKISSLSALAFAYLIFFRTLRDGTTALVLSVGLFFTKAFLIASYTGEAHITSYAFFLASVYFTFRGMQAEQYEIRWIYGAAFLYSIGAAFNLAVFFYGILPAALLVSARRHDLLARAVSTAAALLFSIYIIYPMAHFGLGSFAELRAVYGIYPSLPGPPSPLGERAIDVWRGIGAGAVGGVDGWATGLRVAAGALVLAGAFRGRRATLGSAAGSPGVPFWIPLWIGGFWIGEIAMNTAKSVNGTLYVMLPLLLCAGYALRPLLAHTLARWLVLAAIAGVGALNFERVVLRKITLNEAAARPLLVARTAPPPATPVMVTIDHMSIFESIYTLGHHHGVQKIDAFLSSSPSGMRDAARWKRTFPRSCVLTSTRPTPVHGILWVEHHATLTPDEYHFSVVHSGAERPVPKDTYLACQGVPRVSRAPPPQE